MRSGTDGGTALKPSDLWSVSLCWTHHAEQHQIGERTFEAKHKLDLKMKTLAERFAATSAHRPRI